MKSLEKAHDLKNKKVLIRLDLNMPIKNGKIANSYRFEQSLETLNFLRNQGAKIIVMAHISSDETNSLEVTLPLFEEKFETRFCSDIHSDEIEQNIDQMEEGDVLLLENLRKWQGEKANDQIFSKHLANLADIYVNEAFSVCHRGHASIVGATKFFEEKYAGFRLQKEVKELSKTFDPEKPFVFILGGAKFDTKLPLIDKFLDDVDNFIIGGALANDIYKAQGLEVGQSLVSDIDVSSYADNPKICVPKEIITESGKRKNVDSVNSDEVIIDVTSDSLSSYEEKINSAKTIIWNGPLGNYEKGFFEGTEKIAKMISESDAFSAVGGGDTVAAIDKLDINDKFSLISTGGGAMLQFLANETLPGIDALN